MTSVTVIIPVFNNQKTLERAVLSVIDVHLVSEVIIVDDGSKDESLSIAKNLAKKYKNILTKFHPNNQNRGAAASRNLGLKYASSKWIQFLDSDDEVLKGKLEVQIRLVNENVSFLVGNSIHVFSDGRKHYRKADRDIWKGLIRSKLGDTCANLWNKKYLLEVGGWNENLTSSQEYDLMFRLICNNPNVIFDSRYLTLIHKTSNSISTNLNNEKLRKYNWLDLRNRIRLYLEDQRIFDLRKKYFWSGAVGNFCREQEVAFPEKVNFFFFKIYTAELQLRRKANQIIS